VGIVTTIVLHLTGVITIPHVFTTTSAAPRTAVHPVDIEFFQSHD
jgi:hypothetical protein